VDSYLCQYVDEGMVARIGPGELAAARLRLRNVGTATWRRDGANPILLGTDRPQDRPGRLQVPGVWINPNRPAGLREPAVEPGAIGTFETALRAPGAPGRYREDVRPIAENLIWFNDVELYFALEVAVPLSDPGHGLAAELVEPPPPLLLRPGERGEAPIRLRNSGRVRWTDRLGPYGPLVQLGTDDPLDHPGRFHTPEAWIGANRAARVPAIVLPGQCVDLIVAVTAPSTPGLFAERYRLVAEGVSWLEQPSIEIQVLVLPLA
jgi:hypothetical protein